MSKEKAEYNLAGENEENRKTRKRDRRIKQLGKKSGAAGKENANTQDGRKTYLSGISKTNKGNKSAQMKGTHLQLRERWWPARRNSIYQVKKDIGEIKGIRKQKSQKHTQRKGHS